MKTQQWELTVLDASEGECGLAYEAHETAATLAEAASKCADRLRGTQVGGYIVVGCSAVNAEKAVSRFTASL